MNIDLISDLHIDSWDSKYVTKYIVPPINSKVLILKNYSKYLIVAGDISDNIYMTIDYLNILSKNYDKILFVDGNHEHVESYPNLLCKNNIQNLIKNPNIIYLPKQPYIMNDTAFVGVNGWWNYNNNDSKIIDYYIKNKYTFYKFTKEQKEKLINNILIKSNEEYHYLNNLIKKFDNNPLINKIIIVTHTIPNIQFGHEYSTETKENNFPSQYNSNFENLFISKKILYWIFGHVHGSHNEKIKNINYISNPRGCLFDSKDKSYNTMNILI